MAALAAALAAAGLRRSFAQQLKPGLNQIVRQFAKSVDTELAVNRSVAIVGRPNVGKSALFNRLLRRREALVLNTPDGHLTRDYREGIAKLGDLRFTAIDTAGLEFGSGDDSIQGRTLELTSKVIGRSAAALFVLDARSGVVAADRDAAKWLRAQSPSGTVIPVLNKCEGGGLPDESILSAVGETFSLGFGEPLTLSAESGEGLAELYERLQPVLEREVDTQQAETTKVAHQDGQLQAAITDVEPERQEALQLAIVGRPNVGKSMLVNRLLGEQRVVTGPEAGLTRDAVRTRFEFKGQAVWVVDTAGWMHRKNLMTQPEAALSATQARRKLGLSHVVALILDAEECIALEKVKKTEIALARQVTEEGRALVVVVNKLDALSDEDQKRVLKGVAYEIDNALPQVAGVPCVGVSALNGVNFGKLMPTVLAAYQRWTKRVPTHTLNNWLDELSIYGKVGSGGGEVRVRYLTQIKARPPTFMASVSGKKPLSQADLRSLATQIRKAFGFQGWSRSPLAVVLRQHHHKLCGQFDMRASTWTSASTKLSYGIFA
eukprot:jgi/Chlat1/8201/Chrsp76S07663